MVQPCESIILFSLLLLFASISNAQSPPKPKAFLFNINKDVTTNQYYTNIQIGANRTAFNVVIDLGGKFLWFYSLDYFSTASLYFPILCGSQQCRTADMDGCVSCSDSPPVPGCTNNTCADYALNPLTGNQLYSGLGTDELHVYTTIGDPYQLQNFPFQFSNDYLRQGLPGPTEGVIGLGRSSFALQALLASTFKILHKFALCIPSSSFNNGKLIIGQGIYNSPFQQIFKSLITTPLIINPVNTWPSDMIGNLTAEYFINVKSIRVDNKTLSFNNSLLSIDKRTGAGGTYLRTVNPYTSFHRSIYRVLVNEFVKAARSKNITRVSSVAPFGACFDAKTIATTKTGLQVPIIDLVLHKKNVYWRFYGSNSMVRVSNKVTCLAFVEGQVNRLGPTSSIIIGGYQMENCLLEFDVPSSKLAFSSSLLLHDTSCSQL